ncbi:hypothetical protein CONLIGDRAFT_554115, partial [Coniochaeta ligniaria NRRL 30616]
LGTWSQHPVAVLHRRAEEEFEALIRRQSKTGRAAEAEYVRRYARKPPPGFHAWVAHALKHESPIIDDFDTIAHGIHRYHNLTAAEIDHRMRIATADTDGMLHNNRVERCSFTGGGFSEGCRHFANPLTALLGRAQQLAPQTEFLINFLDEPSVLLGQRNADDTRGPVWEDLSHKPLAAALTEACRIRGNWTMNTTVDGTGSTPGLPFVENVASAKDLCQHSEYGSLHGFLMCPATMKRINIDVPILSQAAPYPFADVLYPSTHYGLKSSLYKQSQDRAWSRKKNAAYWTGSSTGGYWSHDTWRQGHRQRLATIGMHKQERDFTYLRTSSDASVGVLPYTSAAFDNSLFSVGLTRVVGCADEVVCDEQNSFFDLPRPRDSELEAFRYRFVLDIDGNSYSGRFYRFLASRSVPLKVSIFREWHDERLVPWLHYIPVSPSMEELPELMRFLATTSEGQRISHRIAEAGREWYLKALTPAHQGIYLYRLMLELAWMQDASRHS